VGRFKQQDKYFCVTKQLWLRHRYHTAGRVIACSRSAYHPGSIYSGVVTVDWPPQNGNSCAANTRVKWLCA
jgi:hypothetical protein